MIKIVHISDTHGYAGHSNLQIANCNVLCHTGDIGGRTNLEELTAFLMWFEAQPADVKLFCAGNHDHILDPLWPDKLKLQGNVFGWSRAIDEHKRAMDLIKNYDVVYLCNEGYVYEGVKFYGSPYSPSFFPEYWVFNADRGEEIMKQWDKIPDDVNVLLTHTPAYGILDRIPDKFKRYPEEDVHVGCKDLLDVIHTRLTKLKLHAFGHIHDQYGTQLEPISETQDVIFSNGAVLDNDYRQHTTNPIVIEI